MWTGWIIRVAIFDRYKDCGVQAFSDRSHRAHRQTNRLPAPIEATIVRLKPANRVTY